ncbi:unnamed protein product [Effrenium voratum]|nr:unnamed protein product [Effrenium voratum]
MHMMKILDPATVLTEDGKSSRQLCETDTASEFPYEVYAARLQKGRIEILPFNISRQHEVLLDICKMQLTSAKVDGPWHRAWIETLRAIATLLLCERIILMGWWGFKDAGDELLEGIRLFRLGDYRSALRTLCQLHSSEVATAVEALRWSAQANAKLGAHDVAEAQLQQALALTKDLPNEEKSKAQASIQLRLAACEQRRGQYQQAEQLQRAAIASLDRAASDSQSRSMTLASAWNNLGITLMNLDDIHGAREAFEQALALRRTLGDAEGYCLAATNLLALSSGLDGTGEAKEFAEKLMSHLQTARQMSASAHVLKTLQVNLANSLEAAQAWQPAAKARRELFGLAVPEEELWSKCWYLNCARHSVAVDSLLSCYS